MKIEISINCIDDTGRVPRGQTILWEIRATDGKGLSRDARMKKINSVVLKALRANFPSYLKRHM